MFLSYYSYKTKYNPFILIEAQSIAVQAHVLQCSPFQIRQCILITIHYECRYLVIIPVDFSYLSRFSLKGKVKFGMYACRL